MGIAILMTCSPKHTYIIALHQHHGDVLMVDVTADKTE
jgi:hypothetical protein